MKFKKIMSVLLLSFASLFILSFANVQTASASEWVDKAPKFLRGKSFQSKPITVLYNNSYNGNAAGSTGNVVYKYSFSEYGYVVNTSFSTPSGSYTSTGNIQYTGFKYKKLSKNKYEVTTYSSSANGNINLVFTKRSNKHIVWQSETVRPNPNFHIDAKNYSLYLE